MFGQLKSCHVMNQQRIRYSDYTLCKCRFCSKQLNDIRTISSRKVYSTNEKITATCSYCKSNENGVYLTIKETVGSGNIEVLMPTTGRLWVDWDTVITYISRRVTTTNKPEHLQALINYQDVVFYQSECYVGRHLEVDIHLCSACLPCCIEAYQHIWAHFISWESQRDCFSNCCIGYGIGVVRRTWAAKYRRPRRKHENYLIWNTE